MVKLIEIPNAHIDSSRKLERDAKSLKNGGYALIRTGDPIIMSTRVCSWPNSEAQLA
jgi:hypothetical protein